MIAGADLEPKYITTFRHNFPSALELNVDLAKYSPVRLMAELGITPGEISLLAGGPPCQGFSKNVPRKRREAEDSNNTLVRVFLDYCEALSPRIVLMENVAEMKNGFSQLFSEEIRVRLSAAGYQVSQAVLNAADFGVPQRRNRAFFLGVRARSKLEFPEPTHTVNGPQMSFTSKTGFVSVWDAIGDLPSVRHGQGTINANYVGPPFSEFQRLVRNGQQKVKNHVARRLRPTQYARLAALKPGQGLKDLPDHLKVRGGYSGAYGRLTKDMLAPTITRWVFHPGSGRWGHPVDVRTLTIREAARIQGFSDDFEFVGSFVEQAGQIGNAVPPLLVEKIARSARNQLQI